MFTLKLVGSEVDGGSKVSAEQIAMYEKARQQFGGINNASHRPGRVLRSAGSSFLSSLSNNRRNYAAGLLEDLANRYKGG